MLLVLMNTLIKPVTAAHKSSRLVVILGFFLVGSLCVCTARVLLKYNSNMLLFHIICSATVNLIKTAKCQ